MELLKFMICGNVDDGKSTLTGRLLYDTGNIFEDQFADHQNKATGHVDLARVTDGLRAEREHGITIDVAYKYFSTPLRKFICIDAPGHKEYTRNMVSGASQADAAILLIDARHGITEQTLRHAKVCRFLGLQHIIVAINKMDAVDHLEEIFHSISAAFTEHEGHSSHIQFIPVSGLTGANVTRTSSLLSWYKGPTLLRLLETISIQPPLALPGKMTVQQVISRDNLQYIFACHTGRQVANGWVHANTGTSLNTQTEHAAGHHYCLSYNGGVTIQRGDVLLEQHTALQGRKNLGIELFNLGDEALKTNANYLFLCQSSLQSVMLVCEKPVEANEFGVAMLDLQQAVYLVEGEILQGILADPHTKKTIAAVRSIHSSK